MSQHGVTVVGIDVGGERKGFHAVALRDKRFVGTKSTTDPKELVKWCREREAHVIAVDAPCAWSISGSSRLAERELRIGGETIQCFKTPTRKHAGANESGFYGWVFNGERLYRELIRHYALFDGQRRDTSTVFETFPHAVVCALAGRVVAAKPKATTRRQALIDQSYDVRSLRNIDFVDAALCAHTAKVFRSARWQMFGAKEEGFIIVPR